MSTFQLTWRDATQRLAPLALLSLAVGVAAGDDTSTGRSGASRQYSAPKTYSVGECFLSGSRVYIHVDKTGFGHVHAIEGQLTSGVIRLSDPPAAQFVFDMTTFQADTDAARQYIGLKEAVDAATRAKVNQNMLGPDVLNVRRFPSAKFKAASITALPDKSQRGLPQYRVDGKFTLHGVTRDVRFVADAESQEPWIHIRGGFSILQSDFGIKPYTAALGAVGVADRLTIWGDLWAAAKETVAQ